MVGPALIDRLDAGSRWAGLLPWFTTDMRNGGCIMRVSKVLLAVIVLGCGGGGGDGGYGGPTSPGTGTGTGTGAGGGAGTSASVSVRTTDDGYGSTTFAFSPTSVTITRGGTVTWTSEGGVVHNVTFASATGAPANIPNIAANASRTFGTAGSFSYSCTNHSGMTGTVVVQ
jgi:plastocyanin